MDMKETRWECAGWIGMSKDREDCQVVTNTAMKLQCGEFID